MNCSTFTIIEEKGILTIKNLIVPTTAIVGDIVEFVATVKNVSETETSEIVTFYVGYIGTIICIKGTSIIQPGETQEVSCIIETSGWGIETHNICVQTESDVINDITKCKSFELISEEPKPKEDMLKYILPIGIGIGLIMLSKKK